MKNIFIRYIHNYFFDKIKYKYSIMIIDTNFLILLIEITVLIILVKTFIKRFDKMLYGHAQLFIISFLIMVTIIIYLKYVNEQKIKNLKKITEK